MKELRDWLQQECRNIFPIFKEELKEHLKKVKAEAPDTYGYAIVLGEDLELFCSASVVTNTESNLERLVQKAAVIQSSNDYLGYRSGIEDYQFIPDEWGYWHNDVFKKYNDEMGCLYEEYEERYLKEEDDYSFSDEDLFLKEIVSQAYIHTMMEVKKEGGFDGINFITLWISDSQDDVIFDSQHKLNDLENQY